MSETGAFNIFPKNKIKPYDGMAVTAEVWTLAHAEHRQSRQAHDLLFHSSGIITGLEVVANDPPNQFVFISPGAAVDPAGNVIVLPEPVAYDFGSKSEGTLYLLLAYGEREVGGVDQEIKYLQNEFVIAARPSLPKRPVVELARVTLSAAGKAVKNAADARHPGGEELDLRFRNPVGPQLKQRVSVALCGLGGEVPAVVTGWDYLSRECSRFSPYQPVVDANVPCAEILAGYDLVFLSGKGAFKLEAGEIKALRAVLDQGKTLWAEALDAPAEKAFAAVFEKLELELSPLEAGHSLLSEPFLFGAPPEGPLGHQVQLGRQVIFSTAGYSLAWGGGSASRAEIRSAHEWGLNLFQACLRPQGGGSS